MRQMIRQALGPPPPAAAPGPLDIAAIERAAIMMPTAWRTIPGTNGFGYSVDPDSALMKSRLAAIGRWPSKQNQPPRGGGRQR